MIFPITTSDIPLEFDALPALKCSCWQAGSHRVYTLARMYLLAGSLQLSLCAFEREPAPQSMVGFALAGTGSQILFSAISPQTAWFQTFSSPSPLPEKMAPENSKNIPVERFSGVDEQGWYWGARFSLPHEVLKQVGCILHFRETFRAGLLKYGTGPLGTSFLPADPNRPLDSTSLNEFQAVGY